MEKKNHLSWGGRREDKPDGRMDVNFWRYKTMKAGKEGWMAELEEVILDSSNPPIYYVYSCYG